MLATINALNYVEKSGFSHMKKLRPMRVEPCTLKWIAKNLTTTQTVYLCFQMKSITYM